MYNSVVFMILCDILIFFPAMKSHAQCICNCVENNHGIDLSYLLCEIDTQVVARFYRKKPLAIVDYLVLTQLQYWYIYRQFDVSRKIAMTV